MTRGLRWSDDQLARHKERISRDRQTAKDMPAVDIDAAHRKIPKKEANKQLARAEREKWERLFRNQIQLAGFPEAKEQHRFHPERKWMLDFAWPEVKLGCEIEGGIWRKGGGAHSHPLNIERDIEKHNALVMCGWTFFRFTPQIIQSGAGLRMIEEWMARGTDA